MRSGASVWSTKQCPVGRPVTSTRGSPLPLIHLPAFRPSGGLSEHLAFRPAPSLRTPCVGLSPRLFGRFNC
nr:MAG TPA: hypothetical protein [Caudoviricetes sp.]